MKVRLRALQRLVHKEETGDTSPDEESVMADLYRVDERMKGEDNSICYAVYMFMTWLSGVWATTQEGEDMWNWSKYPTAEKWSISP